MTIIRKPTGARRLPKPSIGMPGPASRTRRPGATRRMARTI
jgi:hypothetical protein